MGNCNARIQEAPPAWTILMETNTYVVLVRFHMNSDGKCFLRNEEDDIMFLTNTNPPRQIQFTPCRKCISPICNCHLPSTFSK